MLVQGHRRMMLPQGNGQELPILVETIGYNPKQEKFDRPDGYPFFHWLQTYSGEGAVHWEDQTLSLRPDSGILFFPGVPHRYEATAREWSTLYLTFGGPAAGAVLGSLGIGTSSYYEWETESPLSRMLLELLDAQEAEEDPFGFSGSAGAYRFLLILSKYGQLHNNAAITRNLAKLQPLLLWMDGHYGEPDVGLDDLAERLGVSGRYLNSLFMQTFGLSPYAYFLRLRIRKGKELLLGDRTATVKSVAGRVGFRDASHFVATFRRQSGITPEQFRRLH